MGIGREGSEPGIRSGVKRGPASLRSRFFLLLLKITLLKSSPTGAPAAEPVPKHSSLWAEGKQEPGRLPCDARPQSGVGMFALTFQ